MGKDEFCESGVGISKLILTGSQTKREKKLFSNLLVDSVLPQERLIREIKKKRLTHDQNEQSNHF